MNLTKTRKGNIRMYSTYKKLTTIFLFLFSIASYAYIPPSKYILDRVVDYNGRGIYVVDLILQIKAPNDVPFQIEERWVVETGNKMYLTAKGTDLNLYQIYIGNETHFLNEQGQVNRKVTSKDFTEDFFHFRTQMGLTRKLIDLGIVPSSSLSNSSALKKIEDFAFIPEPFTRLSRTAGAITYAIGGKSPHGNPNLKPGIWIEQDAFLIRKIRFPSQAEMTADNFRSFPRKLKFPGQRELKWNNFEVKILLKNVKSTSMNKVINKKMNISYLTKEKDSLLPKFPLNARGDILRKFYQRFR